MSIPSEPYVSPAAEETYLDPDGRPFVVRRDPVVEPMPVDPVPVVAQPVVAQPVVAQPVVTQYAAQPVVAQPVVTQYAAQPVQRTVATTYGRRYAFDSMVVGVVAVALLIVGLIAVTRAGFDGPMDQPVVKVLGFTHTVTLGLIEAGLGLCLLICAASTSRAGAIFFGLVLGIGGIVGAAQTSSFRRTLELQSGLAWLAVVAAIVVVLVSLAVPRMVTRTARVETI